MSLGISVGALLVASWFAMALTGALFLQTYIYFRYKPKDDKPAFGILAVILCCLDIAHVILIMNALYEYLIINFGNETELGRLKSSLALSVGLTKIVTFLVKSFFCWRIWKLCRWKYVTVPTIFVFLLGEVALGGAATIRGIILGTFSQFVAQLRWVFTSGVVLGVASDILITASLCYWLRETRTEVPTMDDTITKLIYYTIENGAVTSTVSIATLICVLALPDSLTYIALHLVISKLYINTYLASLNNRHNLTTGNVHILNTASSIVFSSRRPVSRTSAQNVFVLNPLAEHARVHPQSEDSPGASDLSVLFQEQKSMTTARV